MVGCKDKVTKSAPFMNSSMPACYQEKLPIAIILICVKIELVIDVLDRDMCHYDQKITELELIVSRFACAEITTCSRRWK